MGANLTTRGVEYSIWAPKASHLSAEVVPAGGGPTRKIQLEPKCDGYFYGTDPAGAAGDAYGFCINDGQPLPDPWSRLQRDDVHGLSLVVDPCTFAWSDAHWNRPSFRDLVIYELHVGTFTPEGTFRAAIGKLDHLSNLGINALQLMPIADFPGERNWGYDGVLIYAPARCYGHPDDLRALVDAAHARGMAVILDVVYNHFGPDGNYLSAYSPYYFGKRHHTPWGDGFNFDEAFSSPVRDFFVSNPPYWMGEFHIDGFRFDATHEIKDDSHPHILSEIAAAVHRSGGYAIAEDPRNEASLISSDGFGFDAAWADDFHHSARVGQTGEQFSYFQDFTGSAEELADTLRHGWHYRGQASKSHQTPRGTECAHLPPERFVHCISNHDQTGNHAVGERISDLISPEAYRALSVLLCLSPYTPMLFMGQEWAASSPFLYFSHHHPELGRKVTEGRRKEFAKFPGFSDPAKVPDPQSEETFLQSKLSWVEPDEGAHAKCLALYKACLRLRREESCFRPSDRAGWSVRQDAKDTIDLDYGKFRLLIHLREGGTCKFERKLHYFLSSEEARFGGTGKHSLDESGLAVTFSGPEALLLCASSDR